MCRPNGCRCTRTFLGAPPTPRLGVSEAKSQTPGADMRRGKEEVCVCVLEIVRPGMEDSESAEKQENTGIGPASTCRVMRGQKRVEDARERAYDPRIHLLREKFLRRWMDCIATRACPSCAVLCAASRASPTCGVKPGKDSEGVVHAKAGD